MAEAVSQPTLVVKNKGLLTAAIMLAMVMQVLDTTIANVALPHMRASLSASQDEVSWVLTSYIVAAAIATPLSGWLADRLGRRNLLLIGVAGFTVASLLCGIATSLPEMVMFRVAQGIFGATLAPLAQAIMLDINPREKMSQAMALFGAGIMVAPIIGPTLGGILTENFDWRAVFLINLPIGILALTALYIYMPNEKPKIRPFDFFGFGLLAIAVASVQMIFDRGSSVGWFDSPEIWLYLGLAISCMWMFVVHCWTAEHPFVDLAMFKDRNFVSGLFFIFMIGITAFAGLALLPPLLQGLMGYSVISSGIVMAPRGVGTFISMIVVGRLVGRIDARVLVITGIAISAWSLFMMTGFDIVMDQGPLLISGLLQGIGLGLVFVPLNTLAFATTNPKHRIDATAIFSLVRNVGQGVGISLVTTILASMIQVNNSEIASRITLNSSQIRDLPGVLQGIGTTLQSMTGLVAQQAAMIAYLDDFWFMAIITVVSAPLVLLLRNPKNKPKLDPAHAISE
ncbi:MAG: DHA2 family efflux MFS transporter permease subunit [Devosia sp.]